MTPWPYLPFLLIWALPVLAFQWIIGGRYLWRDRRRWPWVVLAVGIYFTLADAVAIAAGIWSFDAHALAGWYLGNVPLEEVLFYLLTAAMVIQGFVVACGVWADRHTLVGRWRNRLARPRSAHPSASSGARSSAHTSDLPAPSSTRPHAERSPHG